MPTLKRFTAKVRVDANGCWRWTGALSADRYARLLVDDRNTLAHRWAYEHFIGPIPAGLTIDHLCRVRDCVNPEHLEAVPWVVNIARTDRTRLGGYNRRKTHCSHGHPFDEANTYVTIRADGVHRTCRTCHREQVREQADAVRRQRGAQVRRRRIR